MSENTVARIDATFENTLQLGAELGAVTHIEKSKILCNTTEYWNSHPQLLSKEGYLYIYTDYKQVDNEDVPGMKVGDGTSYLIDMPFMDAPLDAHIADSVKHITDTERAFWNDKVRCFIDPEDGENLVFSTQ